MDDRDRPRDPVTKQYVTFGRPPEDGTWDAPKYPEDDFVTEFTGRDGVPYEIVITGIEYFSVYVADGDEVVSFDFRGEDPRDHELLIDHAQRALDDLD